MSDFLRNLRSSHKKDPSDPKRNLDGHYYPKDDRRTIQDRRTNSPYENLDTLFESLVNILPKISDNSSVLSSFLEQLETNNNRLVDVKLRQHTAIATFFETLNALINTDSHSSSNQPVKVSTSYTSGTHYTKDEILDTMRSLRKQGSTFAQIAEHLTQKGIPTFSGKGDWHAQTIHRLCK